MYVYPGKNSESLSDVYDVDRLLPHVEQDLLTLPEHQRSPPGFSRLRAVPYLFFCIMLCGSLFFLCLFFLLAIILDVLLLLAIILDVLLLLAIILDVLLLLAIVLDVLLLLAIILDVLLLLAIILDVLLRYTASDSPLGSKET